MHADFPPFFSRAVCARAASSSFSNLARVDSSLAATSCASSASILRPASAFRSWSFLFCSSSTRTQGRAPRPRQGAPGAAASRGAVRRRRAPGARWRGATFAAPGSCAPKGAREAESCVRKAGAGARFSGRISAEVTSKARRQGAETPHALTGITNVTLATPSRKKSPRTSWRPWRLQRPSGAA